MSADASIAVATDVLERLHGTRGFVFDLDGTLVLGDKSNAGLRPLPGAIEFTRELTSRGIPFVIFTNGTVRTPGQYAAKLRTLGFPVEERMMLTPASVASDYLARQRLRRVLVFGGEGVTAPLQAAGLTTLLPGDARSDVDAIFIGWYRDFGIDGLELACEAAWGGARMFAASLAPFYATAQGRALGTSRAIAAMITSMTGRRATVLGKPALQALRLAALRLALPVTSLAVVGDDPALEVPMAHRGRALAIAVHSGLGGAQAFDALPEAGRPHLAVRDIAQLQSIYGRR
jgi:HAD superfamily hydrolase (TIGR01450 family)